MQPTKRVFTITDSSHKVRILESYTEFKVDEKLDSKIFDLDG